jgi:multicomponent Na+:H+ antiporter subunit C
METILAFVVGLLIAASIYLMLARDLARFLFGLVLISNAANLLIFAGGGLTQAEPPLVPLGLSAPFAAVANALPQALVLTAIVISFGLLAFVFVLALRVFQELDTLDTDEMRVAEPKPEEGGEGATPPPGPSGEAGR